MSAASPLTGGSTGSRRPINVLTVQPTLVGCLQIQPIRTILSRTHVQRQVSREYVPMFFHTAVAAVHPLLERLFLAVPAQTGLRQGSGARVELVETITAGACSLAVDDLHQQPWCPVAHTARKVLLPRNIFQFLARHVGPVAEQLVGQPAV